MPIALAGNFKQEENTEKAHEDHENEEEKNESSVRETRWSTMTTKFPEWNIKVNDQTIYNSKIHEDHKSIPGNNSALHEGVFHLSSPTSYVSSTSPQVVSGLGFPDLLSVSSVSSVTGINQVSPMPKSTFTFRSLDSGSPTSPPRTLISRNRIPTSPLINSTRSFDSVEPIDISISPVSLSTQRRSTSGTHSRSFVSRTLRSASGGNFGREFHGSFVGSFEESILSGRMSANPHKTLDFIAQIGVLGFGDCKPSLKCPSHVFVQFPAFFYTNREYDSPSPYVGNASLESLNNSRYRIPAQGQLQVIVKNPHKTAVKLFLVPYDLQDMPPATKTVLRQTSYSNGQYILSSAPQALTPAASKDVLRYAVQFQIFSPSKGRYYLYGSVRLVFANRVPDGKEKLRVAVTYPEPKYSTWKRCRPEHTVEDYEHTFKHKSNHKAIENETRQYDNEYTGTSNETSNETIIISSDRSDTDKSDHSSSTSLLAQKLKILQLGEP